MKESLKRIVQDAVQKGEFTLASGKKSSYYIDGKQVTLDQKGAHLCAQILFHMLGELEGLTAVGGPAMGANPIVSTVGHVCFERGLPLKLFYVRQAEKDHGTERWIEGPPIGEGDRAVLVDDVLTSGGTLVAAAKRVREAGVEVTKAICLVDRQEGGAEALQAEGVEVMAIFTAADLDVG